MQLHRLYAAIVTLVFSHFIFAQCELPMVVLITSYNNSKWVKHNLHSVFMQQYENYRIIYIDDASNDKTADIVEMYAKEKNQLHRFTIIQNKKNRGTLANHYSAVHTCQDHEIVVHLDGDDFFKHKNVLKKVNNTYQSKDVWLTYGQNEEICIDKNGKLYTIKGECRDTSKSVRKANAYREIQWLYTHLKTYYAGLFKHIKLKSLFENGSFFESATDTSMMFCMLEMSGGKFKFIDEILYVYNTLNPIRHYNVRLLKQVRCKSVARTMEKYKPLKVDSLPKRNIPKNAMADLIIISENKPELLKKLIDSVHCYCTGIDKIHIIHGSNEFKKILEETIASIHNEHIILAKENMCFKNFVDISNCIRLLEQTYAYGFYLSLGKNINKNSIICRNQNLPLCQEIEDGIYAWQFRFGEYDWKKPNNLLMTLYRKKDILKSIKEKNYNSTETLVDNWNLEPFGADNIGLFFAESKAIEIVDNSTNMLDLFLLINNAIQIKDEKEK